MSRLVHFLERNRTLIILIFCLPASYIFDLLMQLRTRIHHRLFGSPEYHGKRVHAIQKAVKQWNQQADAKRKLLCTSRANWLSLSTKFFPKNQHHRVDVNLFDILGLNEANMTIRLEPMVTVATVTEYLIPRGYTLAVTLEIGDATLGGLAMGTGMTTHSHKVGLYHENVESYEVVLGNGDLVTASATENEDLFKALPWSHGSLGFLVALTLKLVRIKPYIKLTYIPVEDQKTYCDKMRKLSGGVSKDDKVPDYLEATIFSRENAVIMVGEYSDYDSTLSINECTKWYKPWFYKYAESFLKIGEHVELIPIREYLLRHNRAIFWVVESMISFGNNPLFRLMFGWLLPPKPAFLKFTTTPGVRAYTFTKQVFQDIVLPIDELEQQIAITVKLFDLYPLLVYPCRVYDHGPKSGLLRSPARKYLVPGTSYAMYNDLGVYGVPGFVRDKKPYNPVHAMRDMEQFTRKVGGFSFLYADIFMTRLEFEEMFDLELYEEVRIKYHAQDAFPHLFDKVKRR